MQKREPRWLATAQLVERPSHFPRFTPSGVKYSFQFDMLNSVLLQNFVPSGAIRPPYAKEQLRFFLVLVSLVSLVS
jgi:hypothetical protein